MNKNSVSFVEKYSWIIIIILSFTAYIPALNAKLLAWDDDIYILNNPMIIGFNFDNIKTIFSSFYYGLYHPLTILTWNIEHSLVEFKPWLYHFNNVAIHLINTYLVYILFKKYIFKNFNIAFIVSILFGLSTIHVESVAWITERKDVLYTMFYLLALIQYLKFSEKRTVKLYAFSLIFFVLSLLSKGMAITFPIVIILIDYLQNKNILNIKLLLEKIPFLLLSLAFGIINILAQKDFFGEKPNIYNFFEQITFSAYAYLQYIFKSVIPYNLSAFYPYPKETGEGMAFIYIASLIFTLLIIGFTIWALIKNKRKIVFGIIFFTINIVFVLQLFMHNTEAIMSDRYPYLASIGLYLLIGLLYIYIKDNYIKYKKLSEYIFYVLIITISISTFNRNKVWQNDLSLFTDVLKKQPTAYIAANNIGMYYNNKANTKDAIKYFSKAIEINPKFSDAYSNRGAILYQQNSINKALNDLNYAIKLNSNNSKALLNRGNIHYSKGEYKKALADYNKSIDLSPNNCKAHINRGLLYCQTLEVKKAKKDLDFAKQTCPKLTAGINKQTIPFLEYYNKTGVYYGKQGNFDKALEYFNMALIIDPNYTEAKQNILYAKKIMSGN